MKSTNIDRRKNTVIYHYKNFQSQEAPDSKGGKILRTIDCNQVTEAVAKLCQDINYNLDPYVKRALESALNRETSPTGREVLEQILQNAELAARKKWPMCQDTGTIVVFLEVGQETNFKGGSIGEAINKGIQQGYQEGYLRKSMVNHPFIRKNTGDNTPAIIHTEIIPGSSLKISLSAKGGGSENMSAVKMLPPAAGKKGVVEFVLNTVSKAGANSCPPVIVGVGIGGNFEKVSLLAKKALFRTLGEINPVAEDAELERALLDKINDLGIGPQGFGGKTTALAVHVSTYPCHLASLPVAVNLNCHAARYGTIIF